MTTFIGFVVALPPRTKIHFFSICQNFSFYNTKGPRLDGGQQVQNLSTPLPSMNSQGRKQKKPCVVRISYIHFLCKLPFRKSWFTIIFFFYFAFKPFMKLNLHHAMPDEARQLQRRRRNVCICMTSSCKTTKLITVESNFKQNGIRKPTRHFVFTL